MEVVLSEDERAALEASVASLEWQRGLSAFLRELGYAAAEGEPGEGYQDKIASAAEASGMAVGAWLRVIALAAVGYTDLRAQVLAAHAQVQRWAAGR